MMAGVCVWVPMGQGAKRSASSSRITKHHAVLLFLAALLAPLGTGSSLVAGAASRLRRGGGSGATRTGAGSSRTAQGHDGVVSRARARGEPPASFAYATLQCADDWTPGVLALGESLREAGAEGDGSASMVALLTNSVSEASEALLKKVGWETRRVEPHMTAASMRTIKRPDAQDCVPAKFELWRLEEFEKVIFLDADTLVLGDIRSLARSPELSACVDTGLLPVRSLNTGVMVLQPSQATYDDMMRRLDGGRLKNADPSHGDQGALNEYWAKIRRNWHELPEEFNFFAARLKEDQNPPKGMDEESFLRNTLHVKVLHFSGGDRVKGRQGKPWQQLPKAKRGKPPVLPGSEVALSAARGPRRLWHEIYARYVNSSSSPSSSPSNVRGGGGAAKSNTTIHKSSSRQAALLAEDSLGFETASATSLGLWSWCRSLKAGLRRAGLASETAAAEAANKYGIVNCWGS